jgi:hypothetical protein
MVRGEMSSDGFLTQVIIVGDLSKEDVDQAGAQSMIFLQYGGITSDTTMVYNNALVVIESDRTRNFDSLIRRLSSRDRNFLPCLQMFCLRACFDPPI